MKQINRAAGSMTDLMRKVPGVDWTIDNVISGLLRLTNEIVQDFVWRDIIHSEFRKAGLAVQNREDILKLDLKDIDRVMEGLDTKYRAVAAAEGAVAGYTGAAGIVPDIVALVSINLRAAGEYAVYCGFDTSQEVERLFALQILDAVSQPSDAAKQIALAPVMRLSQRLARQQALEVIEQQALVRAIQNATRALGIQLTRAKLADIVPVVGAFIGSGFNAYYTSKVCDTAHNIYRERFLLAKYGPEILKA